MPFKMKFQIIRNLKTAAKPSFSSHFFFNFSSDNTLRSYVCFLYFLFEGISKKKKWRKKFGSFSSFSFAILYERWFRQKHGKTLTAKLIASFFVYTSNCQFTLFWLIHMLCCDTKTIIYSCTQTQNRIDLHVW